MTKDISEKLTLIKKKKKNTEKNVLWIQFLSQPFIAPTHLNISFILIFVMEIIGF